MTDVPRDREEILTKPSFGHVATIGPAGEPQSSPVWIDWDGEFLKFSQTTSRQKVHNVTRNPRVAVSVHDPDDPYRYVEIRGVVERVDDDPDYAFINKMAKKYLGADRYPGLREDERRVVVHVRPQHFTKQ